MGAQPPALRRHPGDEPRRPGAVRLRAARRAGAARAVEAAPGAAPDAVGARQHQGSARHLRQGRAREHARHAAVHRRGPAARVRRARATCTCSAISPTRRPKRPPRSAATSTTSRTTSRRAARARSASGASGSSRSSSSTRASRSTPTVCWRLRCASCGRRRRSSAASPRALERRRPDGGLGARPSSDHPPAGQLVPVAQQQLEELVDFINAAADHHDPGRGARRRWRPRRASTAGRSPACGRPGPFEARPLRAFYYITDVEPVVAGRAAGRAPARLQLRRAVVDLDPRGVPRPLPALSAPAPGRLEAAQVDPVLVDRVRRRLGALLRADDGRRRASGATTRRSASGQLAEALIRLCRFIVGIRLHCEDLSVEQGVRFFRDEAFLEEAERAPRGRARHVRSRLRPVHARAS